jgi:hypothetical protein
VSRERETRVHTLLIAVSFVLACVTLAWRDWIEFLFRADPDGQSGAAEWLVLGASCCVAVFSEVRSRTLRNATVGG